LATKNEVERLHQRQDVREHSEETRAILDWLTPIDYAAQQSDFISRRQAGTGQWLLKSQEFQSWIRTKKQTLFCQGIPGAGKTILASIVIEELNSKFREDESIGIAYIYCNFRRNQYQNLEDLLLSLLKQLAQCGTSMPDAVKSLHRKGSRPSIHEISSALRSVTASFSTVFIVIDALDECQVRGRCRAKFLSEILDLQTKCQANLLITSRYVPEIKERFRDATLLEIRASEEDVRRYLDSHMSRLPKCVAKSPELQEKIKVAIVAIVDGM